jgi:hypothetical protein
MATSQIQHARELLESAWTLIIGTERAIERSRLLLAQSHKLAMEPPSGYHQEIESVTRREPKR